MKSITCIMAVPETVSKGNQKMAKYKARFWKKNKIDFEKLTGFSAYGVVLYFELDFESKHGSVTGGQRDARNDDTLYGLGDQGLNKNI